MPLTKKGFYGVTGEASVIWLYSPRLANTFFRRAGEYVFLKAQCTMQGFSGEPQKSGNFKDFGVWVKVASNSLLSPIKLEIMLN